MSQKMIYEMQVSHRQEDVAGRHADKRGRGTPLLTVRGTLTHARTAEEELELMSDAADREGYDEDADVVREPWGTNTERTAAECRCEVAGCEPSSNGTGICPSIPPPPPCISYALVQATAGVGTVLIWYLI